MTAAARRTPLREAQEQAGDPAGRWMGRGLAVLGLTPGEEVTEAQLRNLFGEWGGHPYADQIEADRLAMGDSSKEAFKADALGRLASFISSGSGSASVASDRELLGQPTCLITSPLPQAVSVAQCHP